MEFRFPPFHIETRRWLLVVGLVAATHILFQSLLLPYGNALRSLLPDSKEDRYDPSSFPIMQTSTKNSVIRNPLTVHTSSFTNNSMVARVTNDSGNSKLSTGIGFENHSQESFNTREINFESAKDGKRIENMEVYNDDDDEDDDGFPFENGMDRNETFAFDSDEGQEIASVVELASEASNDLVIEQNVKQNLNISTDANQQQDSREAHRAPAMEAQVLASPKSTSYSNGSLVISSDDSRTEMTASKNVSVSRVKAIRKKMRSEMPPNSVTSIDEMHQILERHRRSSRAMRPRWSSSRDQEILSARSQIENSPVLKYDQDLYAPLFRNVSKFKKSYELMERILKVYIYKDGKKPIFHVPILKGLYASEGWFMKLMHGDKHFTVKDSRRAHLFYMPFSSRMLEYTLYVRNSHNRTNLRQHLKEYSEKIASKYPYWNRTGGADHFLVACHDWAPYETRHHMEHCIKALCNADVTAGFKIGRDVSLPETYVRSQRNPLRDLGGKRPSQRHILAFYAGNLHGYLRPILLKHWKDKDPDMKIYGPMPPGVASKMNYIQHMKSSKFCICPRGYEVNSPRVVEAIFYECVPVIISDNFVPPFFDVLNWESFSLILAEKDIPNLKEILLSIPHQKYLEMQLAVRKVQRHFLWHPKPLKYDLFYMTLHSIWHNRVYQIKPR